MYKTKLCILFKKTGNCIRPNCTFAHGTAELRQLGESSFPGLLGSVAPRVLYGSNAERLGSAPGTFSNHCLTYLGLYFVGNSLFGWNCVALWFSYSSRSAIRRKFNLERWSWSNPNHVHMSW